MYVFLCVCAYIYVLFLCMYISVCVCLYVYLFFVCFYVCMFVFSIVCFYVCIYVCMFLCVCVYVCMFVFCLSLSVIKCNMNPSHLQLISRKGQTKERLKEKKTTHVNIYM